MLYMGVCKGLGLAPWLLSGSPAPHCESDMRYFALIQCVVYCFSLHMFSQLMGIVIIRRWHPLLRILGMGFLQSVDLLELLAGLALVLRHVCEHSHTYTLAHNNTNHHHLICQHSNILPRRTPSLALKYINTLTFTSTCTTTHTLTLTYFIFQPSILNTP